MIVMSTFREKCQLSMNSPKKLALIQLIPPLAVAATFHGQSLQFADWSRSYGGGSIGTFPLSPGVCRLSALSALSALSHLPHVSWPRSPGPGPGFYSGAFLAFGGATASFALGPSTCCSCWSRCRTRTSRRASSSASNSRASSEQGHVEASRWLSRSSGLCNTSSVNRACGWVMLNFAESPRSSCSMPPGMIIIYYNITSLLTREPQMFCFSTVRVNLL